MNTKKKTCYYMKRNAWTQSTKQKTNKNKYRTYLFSLVQTVHSIAESVQLNPLFIQATQILDEER